MNNFQTFNTILSQINNTAINTSIAQMQRASQRHAHETCEEHRDSAVSATEAHVDDRTNDLSNYSLYKYVGLFLCMTLGACVASIMNKE